MLDPEQDARLSSVAEILRRERPMLTFDEIERVDERLRRSCPPGRARRRASRLAVAFCLALGFLLMSAGTGLAINGFTTAEPVGKQQYPDSRFPVPSRAFPIDAGVSQAETRPEPPFTGVDALPILAAGMALFVTGGVLDRRTGDI